MLRAATMAAMATEAFIDRGFISEHSNGLGRVGTGDNPSARRNCRCNMLSKTRNAGLARDLRHSLRTICLADPTPAWERQAGVTGRRLLCSLFRRLVSSSSRSTADLGAEITARKSVSNFLKGVGATLEDFIGSDDIGSSPPSRSQQPQGD